MAFTVLSVLACASARAQVQTNKLRIGVYDSRAVAVAYANSTEFREAMKPIEAEFKKAREAKNEKQIRVLEEQMKLRQHRAHEQGFSTGSVIPIMEQVKARLPEIAKQANVQVVVSKWELNHRTAEVELVDVTEQLIALFHVNERGLKWCREVQQNPPVSIEEITMHLD